MAEMLLVNPRRRRKAAKSTKRRARRSTTRRRRNPISRSAAMPISGRRRRRRNPIANLRRRSAGRRRRNPISLGGLSSKSLLSMFKDAAIGGAGAIAMDVIQGQVNGFLPASFQTSKTQIGIGDAVKAGLTAVLGTLGRKATRGLSMKMAAGALTVQAYELMSSLVPATMTLGYGSPARIINGSARVGPTRAGMLQGIAAYQRAGGKSPLLNAYLAPGRTPLLNGGSDALVREGVSTYR